MFITSTLPYPNSETGPHVGFLFEILLTDFVNNFFKNKNITTFFNTGIDEEGLKIFKKAESLNLTPQQYLDTVSPKYKDFLDKFFIGYDNFYRTSDALHQKNVQELWNRLLERGDIYKKPYTGTYCVGCESFKKEKELVDGKCPEHPTSILETITEENYFFNLTKYKQQISNHFCNSNSILPYNKINEFNHFIDELEDISISRLRAGCPWGTQVPNDDNHTIYIWFSALCNYIFAAGYLTPNFNWDYVIQTCGPDNLRFQAIIFQAILASEGIKFTDKILIHGTILDKNGKKMSKTEGNVVDPYEQLEKWGIDAVRYYALAGLNTFDNSAWDEDKLINSFNSEICNDWGNLVSRVLHLIDTKLNGEVIEPNQEFIELIDSYKVQINTLFEEFKIKDGLVVLNEMVKYGNKYINDEKPWSSENANSVLSNLYFLIKVAKPFYDLVFPHRKDEIELALEAKKKVILFTKVEKK